MTATLATTFPTLAAHASKPATLDVESDLRVAANLQALLGALLDLWSAKDLDDLDSRSRAVYDDILRARRASVDLGGPHMLDVVQLIVANEPAQRAAALREYSMTRDWLVRTVCDTTAPAQPRLEANLARVPVLAGTSFADPLDTLAAIQVVRWLTTLYFYARATKDLAFLTEPYLNFAIDFLTKSSERPGFAGPVTDGLVAICDWAHTEGAAAAKPLAAMLESTLNDSAAPQAIRYQIAILLSGPAGTLTEVSRADRAQATLASFSEFIRAENRAWLLSVQCDGDIERTNELYDELVAALRERHADLVEFTGGGRRELSYINGRDLGRFASVARMLALDGQASRAAAVIAAVLGIEGPVADVIVGLTADPLGTVWAADGDVSAGDHSGEDTLGELIDAFNKALGHAITYTSGEGIIPDDLDRPGVPVVHQAPRFQAAAEAHLRLDALAHRLADQEPQDRRALLLIPDAPAPVQTLGIVNHGASAPLSVSLRPPADDRAVARVALLKGDVPGASWEAEAVELAFAGRAEIDLIELTAATDFITAYGDPAYDIIWLASHGAQDLYSPHATVLHLTLDVTVDAAELDALVVPQLGRRLLVLNACDSAAAGHLGGMGQLGLSPWLAGPHQAVIGHQWLADQYFAAAFGAAMAVELAAGTTFFAAFERSVSTISKGPQHARTALEPALPGIELMDRLAARNDDTTIFDWGSPAFLV